MNSDALNLLESEFNSFVQENKPPQLIAGIILDGQLAAVYSAGLNAVNSRHVESMRFRIASMTKSFTAAAILILRDEGLLKLSDNLGDFIPEITHDTRMSQTTIFELLSMQSGLPTDDPWADRFLSCSDDEFSNLICSPFVYAAECREQYHYSNLSYMLLGRLITRASGEHALSFIKRRLLIPLSMNETDWNVPEEGRIAGYRIAGSSVKEENPVFVRSDSAAFGGLWSSLRDLSSWMKFLIDSIKNEACSYESILSRKSRLELQRAVVLVPPRDSTVKIHEAVNYALGLRRFTSGPFVSVGHSGGLPGYGSHFRWSQERRCGVIALSNLTYCPVWDPCRTVMNILCAKVACTPSRTLNLLVQQRAQELWSLLMNWSDKAADEIFASNFFQDHSWIEFKTRLHEISHNYTADSVLEVREEPGMGATLAVDSKTVLFFTLAPVENARIQEVKWLST